MAENALMIIKVSIDHKLTEVFRHEIISLFDLINLKYLEKSQKNERVVYYQPPSTILNASFCLF